MRTVPLLLLPVLLLACDGGDDKSDDIPAEVTFRVASFNAGLATGFVPGTDSRLPQIADALAGLEADIVCLQEVWTPAQVAAIDAAVAASYPDRHFPAPQQSSDATCAPEELDALLGCITESCAATCVDDVPTCTFAECALPFVSLSRDCMRCAMANVGNDPDEVASTCETAPVEFAYGGSFGTGLLSKHPLSNVEEHVFESTSNRRSVIRATADVDGVPVDIYCTHLTAVFDTIPYPRDTGDWATEQLAQVDALVAFVDATAGEHQVVVGDLNTGPDVASEGIVPEAYPAFAKLVEADFDVPYLDLDGRCTFCGKSNPILVAQAQPGDVADDELIDHVLTRGVEATAATRILDGEISADSCSVDLSTSALSDHYGIEVTLTAGG
jgi:endonuclease/exonuclease/phosphatase family metal-dependent hydrolase